MKQLKQLKDNLFKKMNNKGNSFVLVLVSIAFIMILVAVITVMLILQWKMLSLNRQTRGNLYYLEQTLNEMRVGVGNESLNQLKTSYDETVSMVVYYDTKQERYMSVSNKSAMNILDNKFLDRIAKKYCTLSSSGRNDASISDADLQAKLLSYIQDYDDSTNQTSNGVKIKFSSSTHCQAIMAEHPVKVMGYKISDITVSRTDKKGNSQSINTDITIYPPKNSLNFLASANDLSSAFTYTCAADYGIEVSGAATAVRLNGNVYAGSDYRNNGIYGGTVASNVASGNTISGSKNLGDGIADNSKYSGIYVTGQGTSLDMQSDVISVNGAIAACNGALINSKVKSDLANKSTMCNLWAKNIVTLGTQSEPKIYLNAITNVADDLELNAPKSFVNIDGEYWGYNYASEEESKPQEPGENGIKQITGDKNEGHKNSSAIIVNGENSTLSLKNLTTLFVNGRSYLDIKGTNAEDTKKNPNYNPDDNENQDIRTAESIAAKGVQLVYRVLESSDSDGHKFLYNGTSRTKRVGNADDELTTAVPYYNMKKFLTWRFMQDKGYKIFQSNSSLSSDSSVWSGVDQSKTNDFMDKVCNDTPDGRAIWKDIKKVYFPTNKVIVAKKNGNNYVEKDHNNKILEYEEVNNSEVRVKDSYNNDYFIYKNEGSIPIEIANNNNSKVTLNLNRYGFITVGKDYDEVALVETELHSTSNHYYFYEFYKDAGKQAFVPDYADYTHKVLKGGDDALAKATFDSKEIVYPENPTSQYTRGISDLIDSGDNKYNLKSSQNSENLDTAKLMQKYNEKWGIAIAHMAYFPKSDTEFGVIDMQMDSTGTTIPPKVKMANDLYDGNVMDSNNIAVGRAQYPGALFTYNTVGDNISPLTNPECMNIDWRAVRDSNTVNGGKGTAVVGYTGAKVWISDNDITIDGAANGTDSESGIILCQGNVTIKNLKEFRGTIICAGKLYLSGQLNVNSDTQLTNALLQNDKTNVVRKCFGIDALKADSAEAEGESISNIDAKDLVGYDNWVKNAK